MIEVKQAVILAGGRGERLRPLTDSIPKPLAPVGNVPFLDYLIESITAAGIKKILILVGYKGDMIKERYEGYSGNGISITFSQGREDDQTGQRLLNAKAQLQEHFLLMYADNYWPIALNNMVRFYNKSKALVTTTVFRNLDGTGEYGPQNNVLVTDNGFISCYDKKRKTQGLNGVDIGYFIVAKSVLRQSIESKNPSFEEDVLPQLIEQKALVAYLTDEPYYYITDLKSLNIFKEAVDLKGVRSIEVGTTK